MLPSFLPTAPLRYAAGCLVIALAAAIPAAASAAALRVEVVTPPPPATIWQQLSRWLGARRPAIGTKLIVTSTAYAPSPYQTDSTPCITAAGSRVRRGTVAANFLPLGTLLEINGEPYIVEDRMNPRYKNSIDIYFSSTSAARQFGRRQLEITIVGYGTPGQSLRKEPADSSEDKTPESNDRIIVDEPGLLDQFRTGWYAARRLISLATAKVAPDMLNRYDVNCE